MAVLEIIVKLSFIDVLAYLLKLALAFEAVALKFSFIYFSSAGRNEFSLEELVVLEKANVLCPVLLEDSLTTSLIIIPCAFVETSLRPLHFALAVLDGAHQVSSVDLAVLIFDAEFVVGERLYFRVPATGLVVLGDINADGCP